MLKDFASGEIATAALPAGQPVPPYSGSPKRTSSYQSAKTGAVKHDNASDNIMALFISSPNGCKRPRLTAKFGRRGCDAIYVPSNRSEKSSVKKPDRAEWRQQCRGGVKLLSLINCELGNYRFLIALSSTTKPNHFDHRYKYHIARESN